MEHVTFTPADAQRIANAVQHFEKTSKLPRVISDEVDNIDSTWVVVKVSGPKTNNFQPGYLQLYDMETDSYIQGETVWIKEVSQRSLSINSYHLGKITQYKTITGNFRPAVLVNAGGGGGDAVLTIVTDVTCTPTGLQVSYATLSGSDYNNAIVNNFLALSDVTPKSYLANQGRVVKVNDNGTALEFGPIVDAKYTTFIALSDTPATYQATDKYKSITVNNTYSGVVFSANDVKVSKSLAGGGNPNDPAFVSITLVNDQENPSKNTFYGTSSAGVRGYRTIELKTISDWPDMAGKDNYFVKINNSGNGVVFEEINISKMLADIQDLQQRVTALENGA